MMKKLLSFISFLIAYQFGIAQKENYKDTIYAKIEISAEFEGGQGNLFTFLPSNIKYPPLARDNGVQGKAIIQFVVEKDGSITRIQCLKIYSNSDELAKKYKKKLIKIMGTIEEYQKLLKKCDEALIEESIRVISIMPKWKPGYQKGEPVRCYFTLPIVFKLR